MATIADTGGDRRVAPTCSAESADPPKLSRHEWWALTAFCAVALALTMADLGARSLWVDELPHGLRSCVSRAVAVGREHLRRREHARLLRIHEPLGARLRDEPRRSTTALCDSRRWSRTRRVPARPQERRNEAWRGCRLAARRLPAARGLGSASPRLLDRRGWRRTRVARPPSRSGSAVGSATVLVRRAQRGLYI